MFEKVNPMHPDKIADRIAGALVDMAYAENDNPKVAVEVLVGHGHVHIINETDTPLEYDDVLKACLRITGENILLDYSEHRQDKHLRENQSGEIRCGDNGIFKGVTVSDEEIALTAVAEYIYDKHPYDGKYLTRKTTGAPEIVICQSHVNANALLADLKDHFTSYPDWQINPLGDWTGGIWVDSGATNRKLGSDMGRAATGGGLHGKDLSKADVTLNILCHQLAQSSGETVESYCRIGDDTVTFYHDGKARMSMSYADAVEAAKQYIDEIGGFEKFAEWGLIR